MTALRQGLTTADLALRALHRWGDRVAFSGYGGTYTYRQALHLVGQYQAVLKGAGARRGDRIALLNPNRADAYLVGIAAVGLGMCLTALHPLGSLEDHLFILGDAEIDYLLVDTEIYLERGSDLHQQSEGLKAVLCLGPAEYGLDLRALADAAGAALPIVEARPDEEAWLSYTGGTTGKSKGAMRRHHSYVATVTAVLAEFEWPDDIVYLAVAPISHVGGTKIMPTLLRGGRVHMMHGFDPERVLDTIATERISVALMVPTMIYVLLDYPRAHRLPTSRASSS